MQKTVRHFLEAAAAWAAGGEAPSRDLIGAVAALETPRLPNPGEARDCLWQILSYPERARSLAILNALDLLVELFPSWTTTITEQDFQLRAVEEVHLERWANGISEGAFQRLCAFHDARVDHRLNGWALTGLATLLCRARGDNAAYVSTIYLDLTHLEATEGEASRIIGIVTEFQPVYAALLRGQPESFRIMPGTLIAVLAHILAEESFTESRISAAIAAADRWLLQR